MPPSKAGARCVALARRDAGGEGGAGDGGQTMRLADGPKLRLKTCSTSALTPITSQLASLNLLLSAPAIVINSFILYRT